MLPDDAAVAYPGSRDHGCIGIAATAFVAMDFRRGANRLKLAGRGVEEDFEDDFAAGRSSATDSIKRAMARRMHGSLIREKAISTRNALRSSSSRNGDFWYAGLSPADSKRSPIEMRNTVAIRDSRLAPTRLIPFFVFPYLLESYSDLSRELALGHTALRAKDADPGSGHDVERVRRLGQHRKSPYP